jgi:gluconate kinase
MLIYLFGLPAAGKNFAGRVLAEEFGYTFYDGDLDLTPEMVDAVREGRPFTEGMRDRFYNLLVSRIAELRAEHPLLAFCQATFKEYHRALIERAFPDIVFLLVEADPAVRMSRLARGGNPVTVEYAQRIDGLFERPRHPHFVITNNDGRQDVARQLAALLEWFAAED